MSKIPIGISSCLLGENVRYDGGHKRDAYIVGTLSDYFEFHPFCPEMAIGLGAPRPPLHLVADNGGVRCVGVKDPEQEVTDRLRSYADLMQNRHADLCGYILKKDSPSCGMERVKVYDAQGMPHRNGTGIYAQQMMLNNPLLPVEEEGRLGDPALRENFIERVFVLRRWKMLQAGGLTPHALIAFHARHKLIAMAHDQNRSRELGRLLAGVGDRNLQKIAGEYIACLMQTLRIVATRGNHVNVLQHIQGYLKKQLDGDDKAELVEVIERYRLGELPLIVPVTLLKHHFRRCPDPYIDNSYYMSPYPQQLKLMNPL
ncbi:MAG: YbgA family protein [Gammaproteobacteria bacterium]